MYLLLIIGTTIALFSYIGRMSSPAFDRMPIREWRTTDLAANLLRGLSACVKESPALDYYTSARTSQHPN